MTEPTNNIKRKQAPPETAVEILRDISDSDLQDLCDATDAAIEAGGGFGWVRLPSRDILERFWLGVAAMPQRLLFVARLDGAICGTAQIIMPPRNNEAQSFAVTLTGNFLAPWARGHGLARRMMEEIEAKVKADGYGVINLDVRETQDVAIKLYESMGYVRIGEHPCYACVDGAVIKGLYYYKILDMDAVMRPVHGDA